MRKWRAIAAACAFAFASAWDPVAAEVQVEPILAQIEITEETLECWDNAWVSGWVCSQSSTPEAPAVVVVGSCWPTAWRGSISGSIRNMGALIDSVPVYGPALPTGAYYTVTILAGGIMFCECCFPCAPFACGQTWAVGKRQGTTTAGESLFIPVAETEGGLTFSFSGCAGQVLLGAGCNRVGSIGGRWILHLPAALGAASFAPGDSPLHSFAGIGVSIDLSSGPGGVVTATNVSALPPCGQPPGLSVLPRYWEVRSDMGAGAFSGTLTISYDPSEVPAGISELSLTIWRHDGSCWEEVQSSIDPVNHTATIEGLEIFGLFVLGASSGSPAGSARLSVTSNELSWAALNMASSFDVVQGDLMTLQSTGGDFTAATSRCLARDYASTVLPINGIPPVGEGYWFVVRGRNAAGLGTYDSGCCSQVGTRDAEIDASTSSCP
jgi:hypothetical protein